MLSGRGSAFGGGLFSGVSQSTLTDTAITGNFALGGAGGGQGYGGGIAVGSGTLTRKGKTCIVLNDASTEGNDIFDLPPV